MALGELLFRMEKAVFGEWLTRFENFCKRHSETFLALIGWALTLGVLVAVVVIFPKTFDFVSGLCAFLSAISIATRFEDGEWVLPLPVTLVLLVFGLPIFFEIFAGIWYVVQTAGRLIDKIVAFAWS